MGDRADLPDALFQFGLSLFVSMNEAMTALCHDELNCFFCARISVNQGYTHHEYGCITHV
jgi:hypothetical protein